MLRALFVLLLLAYPFFVFLGLDRLGPLWLGAGLGLLLLLRLWAVGVAPGRLAGLTLLVVAFIGAIALTGDERVLKAYPLLINLGLLSLFAASLWHPPTVIERGLALAGQTVPPEAIPYLWWVTLAWCGFFVINAALAGWTAFAAPLSWWTLYNGLISYGLIGLMFGAEFIARGIYKRRVAARATTHG